jgi:hypothetical protein
MKHALRSTLVVIVAGFLAPGCFAEGDDCAVALAQAKKVASTQDYDKFDQTRGEGWRALAERQSCFAEAGYLIDSYLARRTDLRESQRVNLSFHAGQVYAFAGRDDEAVKRFRSAVHNPSASPEFKWSEYVLATIAFLEHDGEGLVKNRDVIADAASDSPNQSNLQIVDLLMANFGKSYKDALRRTR